MAIDKEINGYQWNDQIIKWIINKNKQSESEIILWQQVTVCYHEMELVQDKDHTIFIKYSSWQSDRDHM